MASRIALNLTRNARSFSSAAGEFIRGPVQVFGIQGRYAHALYSAATKQGSTEAVEGQLNSLQVSSCVLVIIITLYYLSVFPEINTVDILSYIFIYFLCGVGVGHNNNTCHCPGSYRLGPGTKRVSESARV